MSARESILARIREALRVPAKKPTVHSVGSSHTGAAERTRFEALLPKVGGSLAERIAQFQANSQDLKTEFECVAAVADLERALVALRDREGWKKIGAHAGSLTDLAVRALGLSVCRTDVPYDPNELEACDAGISECDALVAQTGTVVVTSRSAGGRALSVLPPHHVVLARRDQVVGGLPEAFALLEARYGQDFPSMISFITGPSRTGDIERILVLGAHGPKQLTVFCLGE